MFALSPASPQPAPKGRPRQVGAPADCCPQNIPLLVKGINVPAEKLFLYTCADYFPIIYSSDPYIHAETRLHRLCWRPCSGPWGPGPSMGGRAQAPQVFTLPFMCGNRGRHGS